MIQVVDNRVEFYDDLFRLHQRFLPLNDQMTKASFYDEFEQNTRKYFVAIDDKDMPVGYIGLFDCDDDYNIIGIVVDEGYQRQGIGSNLLQKAIEFAIESGKKSLSLEVDESNKKAISFYQKYAFIEVSRRKNYYKTSDAIIMFKYL